MRPLVRVSRKLTFFIGISGVLWASGCASAISQAPSTLTRSMQKVRVQLQDAKLLPSPEDSMQLDASFDVHDVDTMAHQLTQGRRRVPGLAVAIVHNGQILLNSGYGITNVHNPVPVTKHTVFRIASLSKAFASAATGLLINDGLLRWDNKIQDFIPSFHLINAQASQSLTIADILSQRTGLPRNAFDREIEANADYYSLLQRLGDLPLICAPGQCYSYQNVAFSLIGNIIYAASGDYYQKVVEGRIFNPLNMNDASFGIAGLENSPEWAHPHMRSRHGWVCLLPREAYYHLPAAAGVNASSSDMVQWLLAQLGHRPTVLPNQLVATLHTPLVLTPGERHTGWRRERVQDANYALGWRIFNYAGHTLVFHAGAVQGYRGVVALLPERDLGISLLWNAETSEPAGLLPTILDRALGLPPRHWLKMPIDNDLGSESLQAGHIVRKRAMGGARNYAAPK